jgi:glycosyltransferase involved in cell wall biosynthesis
MSDGTAARGRSVVLLLPFGVLGAAEDYMLMLADGLATRGWRVSVAHPQSVPIDESRANRDWEPIGIPDEAMVRPRVLKKHLLTFRPDIIHVNQVVLPSVAAGALTRDSILVVTAHNPALPHHYNLKGRLLASMVKGRPDAWIVLSDRNRVLLASEHVHPRSIHVVPPGLPPARFDAPLAPNAARRALGVPAEAFIVGTVGRLARVKRHDVLIRALSALADTIPELHLAILGDGELREETEQLASELMPGRVTFAGHRADVPRLLRAFDIFALSSDFEGLPFALLEAMAVGRAIVTADVQGAGEAVRDGREGLVVPRRDPDALAAAIVILARDKDLADRLGRAARERFLARFTGDLMVDRTEALYVRLLAAKRDRR